MNQGPLKYLFAMRIEIIERDLTVLGREEVMVKVNKIIEINTFLEENATFIFTPSVEWTVKYNEFHDLYNEIKDKCKLYDIHIGGYWVPDTEVQCEAMVGEEDDD